MSDPTDPTTTVAFFLTLAGLVVIIGGALALSGVGLWLSDKYDAWDWRD